MMAILQAIFAAMSTFGPGIPLRKGGFGGVGLFLITLALTLVSLPVRSAEKVIVRYGILELPVEVRSLEIYATEGRVERDLTLLVNRLNPQQRERLRGALRTRVPLEPITVSQFFYSPQGEAILRLAGEIVQTLQGQGGFYALRSALILASADPEGLTPLNVIKKFPTRGVLINSPRAFEMIRDVGAVLQRTEMTIASIETKFQASLPQPLPTFTEDLRQEGELSFSKTSFTLSDTKRLRSLPVDLYFPRSHALPLPLIVISHGLGSDRQTYRYLAQHLASYGFVVAVPEHPGSNARQLQDLAQGLVKDVTPPRELLDRPLDIKFLLDELQKAYPQEIDWQRVGMVGQSFGGYTALVLAGAGLNWSGLESICDENQALNLSLLLQCAALTLSPQEYDLQDKRIKAVMVINPFTSGILGPSQLGKINIPVAIISSSADTVAPMLSEQVMAFNSLQMAEKYFILLRFGTHFSTLGVSTNDLPLPKDVLGPSPSIAYDYLRALSVAFFKTKITNDSHYQSYLSPAYSQSISQGAMPLRFLDSVDVP